MTTLRWIPRTHMVARGIGIGLSVLLAGVFLLGVVVMLGALGPRTAHADPIEPPAGEPKLSLSVKTVTPTLAETGGAVLQYVIEICNTGAYTAADTVLTDLLPPATSYNGDALASVAPAPEVSNGTLQWRGEVGFDSTVVVSYSVTVSPTFSGTLHNTAVISQLLIARPITVSAETVIADQPILEIAKRAEPARPGPNKVLTYTLLVTNRGQAAVDLPVVVTDHVPLSTTLYQLGSDGVANPAGEVISWTRPITLEMGETTVFTFSVAVNDVPSGTVITNDRYWVTGDGLEITAGEVQTVTVVDPILHLDKHTWPDPPGSNRELTYTLTVLNEGSLATGLVITDRVPAGVTYLRGGSELDGIVSWTLPTLDTGASADVSYTVFISDVAGVALVNSDYAVCAGEGVCRPGDVLTSVVDGPQLVAYAIVDPIAHKPGGGTGTEVTPTLVIENLGPGNALEAQATLMFDRISVSSNNLYAIPAVGTPAPFPPGPECGEKCVSYLWVGDLAHGDLVTFTLHEGTSTIGGDEMTPYTATVVVTDQLATMTTEPISATAIGYVTHYANLQPEKTAPPVVSRGALLTYTISVYNRGMTTLLPPILTDTIPLSTTFVWASHSGVTNTLTDTQFVSWTLPLLGPGDGVARQFSVLVDDDLVSGTQIVNREYAAFGYGNIFTDAVTSGPPLTTTVKDIGLVDSYKEVTPTLVRPGAGNLLTFTVQVVNSGATDLYDVTVYDWLPWRSTTYQRDAIASAGQVVSDIVSVAWVGDVAAYSSETITLTVLVDPEYSGPVTNTAVISHPALLAPVVRDAVAYVTDDPLLRISKSATPDSVSTGDELLYTLRVWNLGWQATSLMITDTLPANTEYVPDSASNKGVLADNTVAWTLPLLRVGESRTVSFRVTAGGGQQVVNDLYRVSCAEGVSAVGVPVVTRVKGGMIYLPLVVRGF